MFNFFHSSFNTVKDRELANATLVFGSRFYKSIRSRLNVNDSNAISLQMELPLFVVSVVSAFISLRRREPRRIIAKLTKIVLNSYALNLEKITHGKIDATSYAAKLACVLSDGPLEYTETIIEQNPEKQPELLIKLFLARAEIKLSNMNDQNDLCEELARCISMLIYDLQNAGV